MDTCTQRLQELGSHIASEFSKLYDEYPDQRDLVYNKIRFFLDQLSATHPVPPQPIPCVSLLEAPTNSQLVETFSTPDASLEQNISSEQSPILPSSPALEQSTCCLSLQEAQSGCNLDLNGDGVNGDNFQRPNISPAKDSLESSAAVDAVSYEIQAGVIRLSPTAAQWRNFPALLRYAAELGANEKGVFKVFLPEDVEGCRLSMASTKLNHQGHKFMVLSQCNGTVSLNRTEKGMRLRSEQVVVTPVPTHELVDRFEQLLKNKNGLKGVCYCTDMNLDSTESRERFGFPHKSPIWPLAGNRLDHTNDKIPGLHWPYGYQAGDQFGAPFACHVEDQFLYSVHYLYSGVKLWNVIPPEHANTLEKYLRDSNGAQYRSDCAQFLRHFATYVPTSILDEKEIPYSVIHQTAREAVVTIPKAYHQGFSAGYSCGEAVNYADESWSVQGYVECRAETCPVGYITNEMMSIWPDLQGGQGQEQVQIREQRLEEQDDDSDHNNDGEDEQQGGSNNAQNDLHAKRSSRRASTRKKIKQSGKSDAFQCGAALKFQRTPKRKTSNHGLTEHRLKRSKMQSSQTPSRKSVTCIAGSDAQSRDVRHELTSRNERADLDTINVIARLVFAIASPDSFEQLQRACTSVRERKTASKIGSAKSISGTIDALDQLDTVHLASCILRRYWLANLYDHRNRQGPVCSSPRKTATSRIDRSSTGILKAMMANAYPALDSVKNQDEYKQKLRSLKNRICAGRNWYSLRKRFSHGILALIPTGGDEDMTNSQIEKLSAPLFDSFVNILVEKRGDFLRQISELVSQHIYGILIGEDLSCKYIFEGMDGAALKEEAFDSLKFTRYCGVEK